MSSTNPNNNTQQRIFLKKPFFSLFFKNMVCFLMASNIKEKSHISRIKETWNK
ncbi:hypothetical protein EfmAA242_25960 [Enterococcus faecium]|nr:hypothetical protein EfmAA242_25960 [Enterococcus faecium]